MMQNSDPKDTFVCPYLTLIMPPTLKTSSPKGNAHSPENKQVFSNSAQVSLRFFFNWSRAANSAVHGWTKF